MTKWHKSILLSISTFLISSASVWAGECDHWSLLRHPNLMRACERTLEAERFLWDAKAFNRGKWAVERECDRALEELRRSRISILEAARLAG